MSSSSIRLRPRRTTNRGSLAGYVFVGGYVVLLLAFGVVPVAYSLWLAVTNAAGQFVGLGNFTRVVEDYRFVPAVSHVLLFLAQWLTVLLVFVLGLALMLHGRMRRTTRLLRFLYYLPGAFAGAVSVMIWTILLDPAASPAGRLLYAFGWDNANEVIAPDHLSTLFMLIAFWTGAGSWIVIMHGALNGIPHEVLEAARIDGANTFQIAFRIQIPMLRRWIAYMLILGFAGGMQVFVEPQMLQNVAGQTWSPNQLSYSYAFSAADVNGAAAIAVYLMVISLVCAMVVVFKARLFEKE